MTEHLGRGLNFGHRFTRARTALRLHGKQGQQYRRREYGGTDAVFHCILHAFRCL